MLKPKQILKIRKYKAGYEVREELMDGKKWGCSDFTTKTAYTPSGDYIGEPKIAHWLCTKKGIKPEKITPEHNVCSIGFCEADQKWYGWSHRAIYGFGIGSTCKKGDCHYIPATPQELFDDITKVDEDGYQWQKPENVEIIPMGVRIKTEMCKAVGGEVAPSEIVSACNVVVDTTGQPLEFEPCEPEYWEMEVGKGEWEAKTLEDARQMAVDFAKSVS